MSEKILCVDDDMNILRAYKRILHKDFTIEIASSGQDGLTLLAEHGPFPVVVSDLRMPEMDGVQFLTTVRERFPDSARVMLTGQADLETAIAAVNEGNIFRFLMKPCSPEQLSQTLHAALEQYNLVISERVLLKETLVGSIQVLTNTLGLVNPTAFGQASRLKRLVKHIAKRLQLPQSWQLELAAMLSQLGCMILSPSLLEKVYAGRSLSSEEEALFASHPDVAQDLLIKIPRLKTVARMIALQQHPPKERIWADNQEEEDLIFMGAHLLKVAIDFDQLVVARGMAPQAALSELRKQADKYLPELLTALKPGEQDTAAL